MTRDDRNGLSPTLSDTVTIFVNIVNSLAIVLSFILIFTDNWFFFAWWFLYYSCLLTEQYETRTNDIS